MVCEQNFPKWTSPYAFMAWCWSIRTTLPFYFVSVLLWQHSFYVTVMPLHKLYNRPQKMLVLKHYPMLDHAIYISFQNWSITAYLHDECHTTIRQALGMTLKNRGFWIAFNNQGKHWMKYVCICGGYILERKYYGMKRRWRKQSHI